MSNLQFALLKKENVPTRQAWQEAINVLGFDALLTLAPGLVPLEHKGFCPCSLNGTDDDVGFEIYSGPAAEIFSEQGSLSKMVGDRDVYIMFRWGYSTGDLACILIACCALAKYFDALISYEGDLPYRNYEELEKTTMEILRETQTA